MGRGQTLDQAKSFIGQHIAQRMISSKTIEFGLTTVGSNTTRNRLHQSSGGYEGIEEVFPIGKPSKETLEVLSRVTSGNSKVDIIDGIVVCQDALLTTNANKAYNRILVLITDGESSIEGIEDLESIIQQMKLTKNFALYIAFMGTPTPQSSVYKQENFKLFESLITNLTGKIQIIETADDFMVLLSSGLGLGTKPILSKTEFQISPSLKFPCVYWSKVSKATAPTLKKTTNKDGTSTDDKIKRDISYRKQNEEEVEVSLEERVKGYRYGMQYIPVTSADEERFTIVGSPSIKLIGFIPKDRLQRQHYLDNSSILHPSLDSEQAQICFQAIADEMNNSSKIGIARLVKRENSDPTLVALIPYKVQELWALLTVRIPCCEDIRDYNFPSLVTYASEKKIKKDEQLSRQHQVMSDFIDSLTAKKDNGQNRQDHLLVPNPALSALYTEIFGRLSNTAVSGNQASGNIHREIPAKAAISSSLALFDAFPLAKVEKKTRKKKFWSDTNTSTEIESSAKKIKLELDSDQIAAAALAFDT